jgi:hypothetical protein
MYVVARVIGNGRYGFRSLEVVGIVKIQQLVRRLEDETLTGVQERIACAIVCILTLLATNATDKLDNLAHLVRTGSGPKKY